MCFFGLNVVFCGLNVVYCGLNVAFCGLNVVLWWNVVLGNPSIVGMWLFQNVGAFYVRHAGLYEVFANHRSAGTLAMLPPSCA